MRNQCLEPHSKTIAALRLIIGVVLPGLLCGCDHRAAEGQPEAAGQAISGVYGRFEQVPLKMMTPHTHSPWLQESWFFPLIMTGGNAIADLDSDGRLDLIDFALMNTEEKEASEQRVTVLRQESPLVFTDQSEVAGLKFRGIPGGVAMGDFNNDGRIDVLLTGYGGVRLYRNDGAFKFTDVSERSGLSFPRWGTSATFLDYDRDGWLDLYVANYVDYDAGNPCPDAAGRLDFCSPSVFPPTSDRLYRNLLGSSSENGGSTVPARTGGISADNGVEEVQLTLFEDQSALSGIASRKGAGLGVAAADFNQDGWIDLFVSNDGGPNFLWINQKDSTFVDEAVVRGVAYDRAGASQGSMGIGIADFDRNEKPDLFVTNLDGESNAVYLNSGSTFREDSTPMQMSRWSYPMTGFGTVVTDLNHDGWPDVVALNGRVRRSSRPESVTDFWDYYRELPLLMYFRQDRFEPATEVNSLTGLRGVGRGLATGDVDQDGDMDLFLNFLDQPPVLLANQNSDGHWLIVAPVEPQYGGRPAIGASIIVRCGELTLRGDLTGGGSYQSTHAPQVHFGLGEVTRIDELTVTWPDGTREQFPATQSDQHLVLRHGEGKTLPGE